MTQGEKMVWAAAFVQSLQPILNPTPAQSAEATAICSAPTMAYNDARTRYTGNVIGHSIIIASNAVTCMHEAYEDFEQDEDSRDAFMHLTAMLKRD
jgi:hypothetical protein